MAITACLLYRERETERRTRRQAAQGAWRGRERPYTTALCVARYRLFSPEFRVQSLFELEEHSLGSSVARREGEATWDTAPTSWVSCSVCNRRRCDYLYVTPPEMEHHLLHSSDGPLACSRTKGAPTRGALVLNHRFHGEGRQRGFPLEDQVVFENYFASPLRRNGTFLELGAHDGVAVSNTVWFERALDWSGVLIEASAKAFRSLAQQRGGGGELRWFYE